MIENPTREQQQAVADEVLAEIRALYAGLEEHGRKGVLRSVREAASARAAPPSAPAEAAHAVAANRLPPRTRMTRPIDVGAVISRMFNIYVDQASVLMPAAAVVFVLTAY